MEKLQYISHCNERHTLIEGIAAVLEGGCRWIQLRMKDASEDKIIETGRVVKSLCGRYGATFILDDHVELVEQLGADGVHLGKNDMPVDKARRLLSQDKIIGATANCYDDISKAVSMGADYIGLGPFRYTTTKKNLSPLLGIAGYRDIIGRCRDNGINIPVVAIGGIVIDDVSDIMATGVDGIAVSGALLNAEFPAEQTSIFLNKLSICAKN